MNHALIVHVIGVIVHVIDVGASLLQILSSMLQSDLSVQLDGLRLLGLNVIHDHVLHKLGGQLSQDFLSEGILVH
jgi:hypothetical protein